MHREALMNDNYMRNCYADSDKMKNHGGLTLISPQYFKFAEKLIQLCDQEISYDTISKRKHDSYKVASNNIFSDNGLRKVFEKCCKEKEMCSDLQKHMKNISKGLMKKIYSGLLNKSLRSTFNAQMKKVRENNTGHYASSSCKEAHRETLKHDIGKHKMKKDGERSNELINIRMKENN